MISLNRARPAVCTQLVLLGLFLWAEVPILVSATSDPVVKCYSDKALRTLAGELMKKENIMHTYKATAGCLDRRMVLAKGDKSHLCLSDQALSAILVACAMETEGIHVPSADVSSSQDAAVRAVVPEHTLWDSPNALSPTILPASLHPVARRVRIDP